MKHAQRTLLQLGDEFLIQYFICAHKQFRSNQILSRLFSMGHSLELYAKAALVSPEGFPPTGHDVPALIDQCDPKLSLSPEEKAAGEALFEAHRRNIAAHGDCDTRQPSVVDLGLWMQHQEAMELYQAQY